LAAPRWFAPQGQASTRTGLYREGQAPRKRGAPQQLGVRGRADVLRNRSSSRDAKIPADGRTTNNCAAAPDIVVTLHIFSTSFFWLEKEAGAISWRRVAAESVGGRGVLPVSRAGHDPARTMRRRKPASQFKDRCKRGKARERRGFASFAWSDQRRRRAEFLSPPPRRAPSPPSFPQ
jgi:hypothetical protein